MIINVLGVLAIVDRFGPFAPTEQKIEQSLSTAREEKVTIALF
jgi:hypothetical protein